MWFFEQKAQNWYSGDLGFPTGSASCELVTLDKAINLSCSNLFNVGVELKGLEGSFSVSILGL